MSAATGRVDSLKTPREGVVSSLKRKLAANVAPYFGWLLGQSQTTGYASAMAASTPDLIALGACDLDSAGSSTAGNASTVLRQGVVSGYANSAATAGDTFADSDFAVPAWAVDNQTIGKLSNYSGSNRSLAGIVLGIDADNSTPWLWAGVVAWLVARATLVTDSFTHAWYAIADAAASTAIAERAVPRAKVHGKVTSVEYVGAAVTGDNTDYALITFAKRGSSDAYAAATTIATYDTRITGQNTIAALTPTALVLSAVAGALNLLPDDVVTIVTTKGGSGKVLTGTFLVNGKAI